MGEQESKHLPIDHQVQSADIQSRTRSLIAVRGLLLGSDRVVAPIRFRCGYEAVLDPAVRLPRGIMQISRSDSIASSAAAAASLRSITDAGIRNNRQRLKAAEHITAEL
jgi:hypothetical protein